ncbi:MAG: SsrA-binding protein SmpB [Candidatus Omnitrophica bacterium]|nr:SsrA-binding protein SmpB [Candidatus Omnitrophota bacterium]
MAFKVIATNRKAHHNYHLSQNWECGIALTGGEVKSIRNGEVNFADSFAAVDKEEIILYNLHINPYLQASYLNQEPARKRKLLLHRKEIERITAAINEKGLVLIPTKIYFNKKGFVKVEIALGKGKKLYDKREDIKKRDIDRDLRRAVNTRRTR